MNVEKDLPLFDKTDVNMKELGLLNREDHLNYDEDAELYIKHILSKKEEKKMDIDSEDEKLQPDKNGEFESCEVVLDQITGRHFDLIMTKIDVKKGYFGVCSFYVMQLLFDKVKQIYILWTRWGRIGDVG